LLFSTLQWALIGFSLIAIGLLFAGGRAPERLAAFAFLSALVGTPLVEGWRIMGLPMGVALLEIVLTVVLLWLSLASDRWWLLAATGVQIISPLSYLLAAGPLDIQVWAAVTVRIAVWALLMFIALFGLVEARRAPYAAPRGSRT